jgi:hypothetical protein
LVNIVAGKLVQKKPTPGKCAFLTVDDDPNDLSPEQGAEMMEIVKKCKNYKRSPCFKLKEKEADEKKEVPENVSLTPFSDLIKLLPNSDTAGVVKHVRVKIN